jgi:hypothetical protein
VSGTVEIDMIRVKGPDFKQIDNRLLSLKLVKNGLTKTAMFGSDSSVLQPSEALYKKNALVISGRFRPFTRAHEDMLAKSTIDFVQEIGHENPFIILSELSLNALIDTNGNIDDQDFLDRANILCALGHTVMITNFLDYWYLVPYMSKITRNQLVGFVLSVRNIERIFDPNQYTNLQGGLLEALSMLFGSNVKAYAYPALRSNSDELITINKLQIDPKFSGLLRYLIDNHKLEDVQNIDESVLHINADEVIQQIQNAVPGWEESVPKRVAELIKINHLLNFPVGSNSQNKI